MSERRRARSAHPATHHGIPLELGDPLHPIWRDTDQLAARFGALADAHVLGIVRLGGSGYHRLGTRWALAHGYESPDFPSMADWRALRAALNDGRDE